MENSEVAETFGDRVRAMRIERNLSLEGIAALLPGEHHFTWVSKVEKNQINLKLSDIYALAGVLQVEAGWLLSGDREDSEFVARVRGMEPLMDERGQRAVLAVAQQQVDELAAARKAEDAFDVITRQMLAAGLDPETTRRVVDQSREIARESAHEERVARPA